MKTTNSNNKRNLLVMFICTMIVLAVANYSSIKEIKKQVQEQEQNDYSDALIKSCEPYNE